MNESREMHILFGFANEQIERAVKKYVESNGYRVSTKSIATKKSIREYLMKNRDCGVAILQERVGMETYRNPEELAALTDNRNVNVVIVLSSRHKGTDFMVRLYNAGIMNAIFTEGRNGATVRDIGYLVMKGRSRKEAREYYGIDAKRTDAEMPEEAGASLDLYEIFSQGEGSTVENYFEVCRNLSISQIADFTKMLPGETKEELAQYEEFHTMLSLLRKAGYDLKIGRPKKVSIAFRETLRLEMSARGIEIGLPEGKKEEKGEGLSADEAESLSMEELFALSAGEEKKPVREPEEENPVEGKESGPAEEIPVKEEKRKETGREPGKREERKKKEKTREREMQEENSAFGEIPGEEDYDSLLLSNGEGSLKMTAGFLLGAAVVVVLICFVGWLAMGNHLSIGDLRI